MCKCTYAVLGIVAARCEAAKEFRKELLQSLQDNCNAGPSGSLLLPGHLLTLPASTTVSLSPVFQFTIEFPVDKDALPTTKNLAEMDKDGLDVQA
ncbi:uncharacterized protein PgNI_08952 [Pyricularia grisea]|uniref:Uncharacterized protein n=1 Tax=Pyricularia grisea TaxID=148305 RepID=A0A6P8AW83_PYRGI|nr:uncharacterized protein PgNI_08952 [Pyricularia grisea]TLD06424.1 hypothetical protein PgNI_08952 [Pyricularia grisea]